MLYACLIMNHLASAALGWKSPEQVLTGQTQDISTFLHFSFHEPVYCNSYSNTVPSASDEEQGWWVGVATHVGDALIYKILTKQHKVIYRSAIWSALDPAKRNQCHSPTIFIRSQSPLESNTDTVDGDLNLKKRLVMIDQ
jgi:hypothetical protein